MAWAAVTGGVGERGTGELAVGVVVGVAQQRAEPVDLRGAGHGEVEAGAERNAQGFAVVIGARNPSSATSAATSFAIDSRMPSCILRRRDAASHTVIHLNGYRRLVGHDGDVRTG